MDTRSFDMARLSIFIIIMLIILAIGIAQPYFEAKHFNQMTGSSATYWDAVWTDLRVIGEYSKDTR